MKRTVEINDTLQERIDSAIDDVREELLKFLRENPEMDETPDLGNDLDYSGAIHEIVDGSVPIYTKEIDDTWYLYGDRCEAAFDAAGFEREGDWPSGWQAAAIYCYIEEQVNEWYSNNADDVFNEWRAENPIEE